MSKGKNFTRDEILAVIEASKNGEESAEFAKRIGRSASSVRNIAHKYGYSFRVERKRWHEQIKKGAPRRKSVAHFIEAGKAELARAR